MSEVRQAEMVSSGGRSLMLLGVKANGAVKGRLLVMTLEQRYRNSSDANTEITYTFPLPQGAVLMEMEVELNGQLLKGEVSAKAQARAQYEEAISEGNSSIMLEKNSDGSFTLELGNLMAREECKLMIRYSQVLQTEHGQVRLMLPTTIAPRYGNPLTQGKLQPHQVPVTDLSAEYPFDITLTLMGDMASNNVGSPSHKTSYLRNQDDLIIKLSQRGYLDRDFILVIDNLKSESDALICKDLYVENQYAVMAFFNPVMGSTANGHIAAKVLVDCSGSMAGDSIDAARRALQGIVSAMTKDDKLSLSRFGSTFEHRSRGMWSATPQAKSSAMRWIKNLQADLGGTEMADALVSTLSLQTTTKADILLITDGEIEGIDEVIDVAEKSKHRVFVVAIGASPAETHLRRLATATGGHCDFVAPGEAVEPAVIRMSSRMRAARATHMRVEWPTGVTLRWAQQTQSYAFENDMFIAHAFVDTPLSDTTNATAKLWGKVDGYEGEILMAHAALFTSESSINTLARLVAHAQYLEMTASTEAVQILPGGIKPLAPQELATTYKLVTDQTNFILVHDRSEEEKAKEMPIAHKAPQMLAAGWGGSGLVSASVAFSNKATSAPSLNNSFPAVFRMARTSPSDLANSSLASDADSYDIPAYLRKHQDDSVPFANPVSRQGIDKRNPMFWKHPLQTKGRATGLDATFEYTGITPAGLEKWLSINAPSLWPTSFAGLIDLGLGAIICEWLEFGVGAGHDESTVVTAFLNVVREFKFVSILGFRYSANQSGYEAKKAVVNSDGSPMIGEIRSALKALSAHTWPAGIVNFPETTLTYAARSW